MQPETFIRPFLRTWLRLCPREHASRGIRRYTRAYLDLAEGSDPEVVSRPVRVPKMPGVDEDMREWSFYMLLEHNVIVNRSIAAIVRDLVADRDPAGAGAIDPKRDVMPSGSAGPEQVERFSESVEAYLSQVSGLGSLRGTRTKRHPVFGDFDAHMWHGMFGFHLKVHLRQARFLAAGKG